MPIQNYLQKISTLESRGLATGKSLCGLLVENVGGNPNFKDEEDFQLFKIIQPIFNVEREGDTYYFPPIVAGEYLKQEQIKDTI